MRGTLVLAIAFLFSIGTVFAQTVTTPADVNLNVNNEISITKIRDLRMGTVVQGTTTSVNINPLSSGSSAYFTLTASPNSSETITFSSTNLTNGSGTIMFTGALAGNDQPIQPRAILIVSGNAITTNATGDFYLWAGGSAALSPNQAIGEYTGSFTVSVVY